MTENNRFTLTYIKIGEYFDIGIVDHETKEPFDDAIYEFHQCSFKDSKDEMEDLCLLLNELNDENEQLQFELKECSDRKLFSRRELKKENERIKHIIQEAYETERTAIGKNVLKQLLDCIGVME